MENAREQRPSICRMVIYRSRAGVDMPAVITAVIDDSQDDAVHLEAFPPPGVAKDTPSYQHGVQLAPDDVDPHDAGAARRWELLETWRWPERV